MLKSKRKKTIKKIHVKIMSLIMIFLLLPPITEALLPQCTPIGPRLLLAHTNISFSFQAFCLLLTAANGVCDIREQIS